MLFNTIKVTDTDLEEGIRQSIWLVLDNRLDRWMDLTRAAEDVVQDTYDAYISGTPLTGYQETLNGHFDGSFIDTNLMADMVKSPKYTANLYNVILW